jgi:L-arabinose isomerase
MQELYDESYPGITQRQEKFARKVINRISEKCEVFFPGAARTRDDIERILIGFNEQKLDGIILVNLTYSPGLRLVRALKDNQLPILLANIQPESKVGCNWDMSHLTFNQGVHGAQDTANTLLQMGCSPTILTEEWDSDRFKNFVIDWSLAAKSMNFLKSTRLASIGQMPGMGDILTDSGAFLRKIGPQIDQVSLGKIYHIMSELDDDQIVHLVEENAKRFEIDPQLSRKNHLYAAKLQIGIEKFLEHGKYSGFSIYFGAIGDDGRFNQLHMMAASNLMAKGYGYAAEGDMCCTALVAAGQHLAENAHFTEMYAMDFEKNSILQSHMGEGNWKIARKDQPIRLINRQLDIGGLDNPPTIVFMAEPGPATLASLCSVKGAYRLVVTQGEVLDTEVLSNVEMPYFHFAPNLGVRECLNGWLENGGTHHQCLNLGDHRQRWKILCRMLGIEYIEV